MVSKTLQTNRQTNRQTERQTNRQTHKHTDILLLYYKYLRKTILSSFDDKAQRIHEKGLMSWTLHNKSNYICLSIYLYVSVCLSVPNIYIFVYLCIYVDIYLSIYQPIFLSYVYLDFCILSLHLSFICQVICVSIFL